MTPKKTDATPPESGESTTAEAPDTKKMKHPSGSSAKIAALEEKLAGCEKSAADLNNRLLRTAAEYDNFRRRSKQEQDAAFGNGVSHAALQLLPVLDTLEAAANAPTTDEEYKKGVLLTLQKCEDVFSKLGITEIAALGQPFDPELHNACMQEPAEDCESGTVTRVVQKGYQQNGKVIRHAMVAVCP